MFKKHLTGKLMLINLYVNQHIPHFLYVPEKTEVGKPCLLGACGLVEKTNI